MHFSTGTKQLAAMVLIVFGALSPEVAWGQLISIPTRKDHAFDPVNRILYVTTTSGTVERWDAETGGLLSAWTIGGDLGGVDVTPDGATVLVADRRFDTGTDLGLIHRVDAASGVVTTLEFPLDGGQPSFTETGSWDVVALSNGRALFTTDFVGSAWVPFHQLDLATNVVTPRTDTLGSGFGGEVRERTWVFRNGDHSVVLGLESDSSGGPFFSYSAVSDTFLGDGSTSSFHSDGTGAVSADGDWLAVEVGNELRIYESAINASVQTIPGVNGGVTFHPVSNYLFGLNATTDEVVVYRTGTWSEIARFAAGVSLDPTSRFDDGVVSFDAKTNSLFVSVAQGVQRIKTGIPEPSSAALCLLAAGLLNWRGARRRPLSAG